MPAKTRAKRSLPTFTLDDMVTGCILSLEARNLSDQTILLYRQVLGYLSAYLEDQGHSLAAADIRKTDIQGFMQHTLQAVAPTTADIRFRTLRAFFNWAAKDGYMDASPMAGLERPKLPAAPKPHFTVEEMRLLLQACRGQEFEDVRDTAILRFFMGTGCRLGEVADLRVEDVDIRQRRAVVTGKGSATRRVRLGPKIASALHKYLLLRARHPGAAEPWLWLGRKGRLTSGGISLMLSRRARLVELEANPHKFRHTFAHYWRLKNGSVVDLEVLMGWSPNSPMSRHYGASAMAEVALEHADEFSVGEDI